MINRTLHAITNRAGGFNTRALPLVSEFRPSEETQASAQLRALLGLDRKQDDYHVFAALAAVESHPEIQTAFQDEVCTYQINDYINPTPRFSHALVDDALGVPRCALRPTEAPVPASFSLGYVDTGFGVLTYGARREIIPVDVVAPIVYPRWPAALGFNGGINITWEAGATFTGHAYPVNFPYDVMALRLREADCKNEFLLRHDLLNQFHQAPNAVKQVALTLLALGLSNPAAYG